MKLNESKLRRIIRDQIREIISEDAAATNPTGLSRHSHQIFQRVVESMQEAEEMAGPENYVDLMNAIIREARQRKRNYHRTQS